MVETAAQSREGRACDGTSIIGRKAEADKCKAVKRQPKGQKFFAANLVGKNADGITRQIIGETHDRGQQSCLAYARQMEVALDEQVERDERNLVEMGKSVQHTREPEGPYFMIMMLVCTHGLICRGGFIEVRHFGLPGRIWRGRNICPGGIGRRKILPLRSGI